MMLTRSPTPDPWDWQPTDAARDHHNLGGVQQSAPHSTPSRARRREREQRRRADGDHVDQPVDPARSVGLVAADGDAPRDHAQPRRGPAVGAQPHVELALQGRRGRHVLPGRQHRRRQPTTTPSARSSRGAIPQTYDCGHDDYFNPDPAPGSYLDHALERLHAAPSWASCAHARHGVRRRRRARAAGQHRAADRRRHRRSPARGSTRRAPGRGSTRPTSYALQLAARRRRRLGRTSPARRGRLPRPPTPTSASPCACRSRRPTRTARRSRPRAPTAPVAGSARRRRGQRAQAPRRRSASS